MDALVAWTQQFPRRYLVLAVAWGAVVLVLQLSTPPIGGQSFNGSRAPALFSEINIIVAILGAAACVLALNRLLVPVLMVAVVPLGLLFFAHTWAFMSFASLLGVLAVSTLHTPRRSWVAGLAAMAFPLTYPLGWVVVAPDGALGDPQYASSYDRWVVVGLYAVVAALALGCSMWFRSATEMRELDRSRQSLAKDAALLGERSRLARDLHDVVAHHVSLIAVRAETAPYTVPDLQPAARVVLADIAEDARRALDELRGVLGILRRAGGADDRAPQPTGADVAELVETARAAGPVELTGEAALVGLDATRGYVAYRVVQEALTNARRHAPGGAVSVAASVEESGGVLLRVTNPVAGDGTVTPGRGLTGMRERVEAVGGTLTAEVRAGEFVVEVRLP